MANFCVRSVGLTAAPGPGDARRLSSQLTVKVSHTPVQRSEDHRLVSPLTVWSFLPPDVQTVPSGEHIRTQTWRRPASLLTWKFSRAGKREAKILLSAPSPPHAALEYRSPAPFMCRTRDVFSPYSRQDGGRCDINMRKILYILL
ncbi:hypothetical protein Bbelb_023140 [Branchiostoma belcheri]|nr:hypothetical protein Bbelb_023140 [Branchiostoma belcheri]